MSGIAIEVSHHALADDRAVVGVLVLPGRCWRCHRMTFPIVGVLAPGKVGPIFLEFSEVAEQLARSLSVEQLREIGTGPIRPRRSRARPVPYLSNGCVHCDAIQGEFPLREDLAAFRSEGGTFTDLLAAHVSLRRA